MDFNEKCNMQDWNQFSATFLYKHCMTVFRILPTVTLSHCHTVTLSNHDELTLACAEKKAFYNYHSALQTTDDNFPTRLWNTNFVPNSELFFSGPYVRPDGEIQWTILHGVLSSRFT